MKVFNGIAGKGKRTMECYVGFKLHLLCNEKDEIANFVLTKANVDDRNLKRLRDNNLLGYSRHGDKYWYTQSDIDRFLSRCHDAPFAENRH